MQKKVGEAIRDAREKAGLSQQSLAHAAGISRVYVSMLERNVKSPTLDVFFRVCEALGVAPSKVIMRIEKRG